MPELKELLGDAYKEGMTFEEASAALKDRKIVDLAAGEYVGKGKYETAIKERDDARKERDDANVKYKDYDELVKYRKDNEAAKAEAALKEKLKGCGVRDDMVDFVKFQLDSGKIKAGEKGKDVEANVKAFLKDNPQYAAQNQPKNDPAPKGPNPRIVSGGNTNGGQDDDGKRPAKRVASHPWNSHRY